MQLDDLNGQLTIFFLTSSCQTEIFAHISELYQGQRIPAEDKKGLWNKIHPDQVLKKLQFVVINLNSFIGCKQASSYFLSNPKWESNSMGSGKIIVEFFSAEMVLNV